MHLTFLMTRRGVVRRSSGGRSGKYASTRLLPSRRWSTLLTT